MSDIAGISSNAVLAYQNALSTVSNNIANVATEGYSRQELKLSALPPTQYGTLFMGSGAVVDSVKRQYDSFVESNLRNSASDLAAQGPMVRYASRVVDLMGGETMGLNTALDEFFSAARALSADPSSTVLRSSFLRDADGVAQRFGQLSEQLDLIQSETDSAIDNAVTQMNALTKQLGVVNGHLNKQLTEAKQPPDLLDQRDLLLKKLSGLARINTTFATNGQVSVSLGSLATQDVVVSGTGSVPIGVQREAATPDKASLVLDPYGKPKPLTAVSSGTVAGLMAFNDQVLGASKSALNNLAQLFASQTNTVHTQGIDIYGEVGSALFSFDSTVSDAAAGMRLAFSDPQRVAAAAQFRVTENANNVSTSKASLAFDSTVDFGGPATLSSVLVNNDNPAAGKTINVPSGAGVAAVATIPQGMQDLAIYLDTLQSGQQLQVLTRDGRQLIGQSMAQDSGLQAALVQAANGFAEGASYSDAYLNSDASPSYKGMSVFYGAQAQVRMQAVYDNNGNVTGTKAQAALLQSDRIGSLSDGIEADTITVDGVALGALPGPVADAQAVADWINTVSSETGVTASAVNLITVAASQLKLDGLSSLSINGQPIDLTGVSSQANLADAQRSLVNAINGSSDGTFMAKTAPTGELIITNGAGFDGQDITIDNLGSDSYNALGIAQGSYRGQVSLTQPLTDADGAAITDPIRLSFGSAGTPSDLAQLGFRSGAFIAGATADDLLVFVTGAGAAQISASYSGSPADAKQALRANPMNVQFLSSTRYRITDVTTNTVLAERDLVPSELSPGIRYQGLELSFTSAPSQGDQFLMDGNADGIGNNANILAMNDLETKAVLGSKTIGGAYIDQVNEMGNIAQQASISQTALTVVHEQAVAARDQVAGVSLDKEAGELIRFQQAYQAAAKALQTASQLFDTVLQIR
jgi:flagellar hook-associated protein FlgK